MSCLPYQKGLQLGSHPNGVVSFENQSDAPTVLITTGLPLAVPELNKKRTKVNTTEHYNKTLFEREQHSSVRLLFSESDCFTIFRKVCNQEKCQIEHGKEQSRSTRSKQKNLLSLFVKLWSQIAPFRGLSLDLSNLCHYYPKKTVWGLTQVKTSLDLVKPFKCLDYWSLSR